MCGRLAREKHAFLNLFEGFFTYDQFVARMIHPENRAGTASEMELEP